MLSKLIKWLISILLCISGGYYVTCKFIFHIDNYFVVLIDFILSCLGIVLNFLAQHIFSVLIVVALSIILWIIYRIIVYKNRGDKE